MPTSRRILLCRIGLLLFCVLPTVAVISWVIVRSFIGHGAASKEEWERELTSRLGLDVEIGAVSYPHGAVACLSHVRLVDPETKALVALAQVIEVGAKTNGWVVAASQLEIEARQLGTLHRVLHDRVLRTAKAPVDVIQLLPGDLTLRRADQNETLRQCGARLTTSQSLTNLELEFQIGPGSTNAAPVHLRVTRNRDHSPPQTSWQLETGGAILPCRLLADVWPPAARLGTDCSFDGSLQLVSGAATSGQLSGDLHKVDLDALVSEQLPHQLSGIATVSIEGARLEGGKLVELRGDLQATSGSIGHSLVVAAQQHLGLLVPDEFAARQPSIVIPFTHLAMSFLLDGKSLTLAGNADPAQPGVIIANATGPILAAPPQHHVPAVALLRTLLPDSQYQVPATRQTAALVSLFPVPHVLPTTAATHTPTRLSPDHPPAQSAIRQPKMR